ncbi:MAG: imidazole glycerol phosphate synthase subunit HisH [Ignavibacteriae bacterium]|nr:imidazole glycerol phosphate synthase subunit HisH [Ignavibacteriota bacterium]
MITIIDYGLGNIRAFINVYNRLNIQIKVAKSISDLEEVTKIILPGVGAFDHAMTLLQNSGMREKLDELVLEKKIPTIGICVGMQIMAASSEEGVLPGLGWFSGSVKKFDTSKLVHKPHLPHMGWNVVNLLENDALFNDLEPKPRFYFLHSYYFSCENSKNILATAEYGDNFTCVIKNDNIYGVQFHPEKSHHNGVQILKNFGNL